jgi:mRNA-degrading endonuclease RelE of RelBE toxin-antitoxin system
MYSIDFTGTGSMTLEQFSPKEQQQVMYVLNKAVAEFNSNSHEPKKLQYLGDGFYVVRINQAIRVMAKIENNTFSIIDVFNYANLEKFASQLAH